MVATDNRKQWRWGRALLKCKGATPAGRGRKQGEGKIRPVEEIEQRKGRDTDGHGRWAVCMKGMSTYIGHICPYKRKLQLCFDLDDCE